MHSDSATSVVGDDLGSVISNQPPKLFRVFGITINDQIPLGMQCAHLRISHVAGNLKHPRFVRSDSDCCNVHNAIGKTDHEQQVVSDQAPCAPQILDQAIAGTSKYS